MGLHLYFATNLLESARINKLVLGFKKIKVFSSFQFVTIRG